MLRIEDTDRERSTEAHTKVILDGLTWLGITWDEGPFFQGAYGPRHKADAERLVAEGKAYYCFCTREELDAQRREAEAAGDAFRYDRRCYRLPREEVERRRAAGEEATIRFFLPDDEIAWDDAVHGRISFQGRDLDDFVILRSDDSAIYNMAVVSDDIAMDITHVIRGDDHISNTPKQIALYRALGHETPGLRARPDDPRTGRQEALQAARRHGRGRLPGPGDTRAGHAELPRPARLVPRRRPRDRPRGGDDPPVHPGGDSEEGGGVRRHQAGVDERAVPERAAGGRAARGRSAGDWRRSA